MITVEQLLARADVGSLQETDSTRAGVSAVDLARRFAMAATVPAPEVRGLLGGRAVDSARGQGAREAADVARRFQQELSGPELFRMMFGETDPFAAQPRSGGLRGLRDRLAAIVGELDQMLDGTAQAGERGQHDQSSEVLG